MEWNEWALALGLFYFALRYPYLLVRNLWWHGGYHYTANPVVGTILALIPTGLAGAAIVVGLSAIVFPGVPLPFLIFAGFVGFMFALTIDLRLRLRLIRLEAWIRSFRVSRLREQLLYPDADARYDALVQLQRLGDYARPALPEVRSALRDESREVRTVAAQVILNVLPDPPPPEDDELPRAARASLGDSNPLLRTLAACILVRFNAPVEEVLPILRDGLTRNDTAETYAAEALGRLGPAAGPAIPVLLETVVGQYVMNVDGYLMPNAQAVPALAKIGGAAVPALIEVIERGNPTSQYQAAEELGNMGETALPALASLRRLALKTSNFASLAAKQAIEKLGGMVRFK
jgi:PBS lyase HEAT-like repeat-containing protein